MKQTNKLVSLAHSLPFQLLDMASKLGPALQVGEGLVWKPPASSAPEAAAAAAADPSSKPPATSVDVAREMDNEISRGGAAYIAQDGNPAPAAADDGNNNNNTNDEDNDAARAEHEPMGLDRKDFESLEQESSVDDGPEERVAPPPEDMVPPRPSEAIYALPIRQEGMGLGGGLPPLRGGMGGKGGLPSLADLPPLPTEDPNDEEDDDDDEIEEEIETQSKRRALPAL